MVHHNKKSFDEKKALYLSVNVFSTKVLSWDTIFTSPAGDRTASLRGQPSNAKVQPLMHCKGSTFISQLF